ncbi:MAG: AraC family transcriptional regulator ligand-binding domain-containing protein [Pseudomonadota bacterium]
MTDAAHEASVSSDVVQVFLQIAEDMGVKREVVANCADIDPIWLENIDKRVSAVAFYRLTKQLAALTNDNDIGLWAGRGCFLNQSGVLKYLSLVCTHFRQWLNMIPSTFDLIGGIGESVVVREGDVLRTEWRPVSSLESSGRHVIDMMLSMSLGMLSTVCHRPIPVRCVHFVYPKPKDTTAHRLVFGDDLKFDQPFSGLVYGVEALDYAILKVRDDTPLASRGSLLNVIEKGISDAFLRRIRRCIVRELPSGNMSIDTIAGELAISRRTLQRRLSERGLSFAAVVQELRSTMAVRLLIDKTIPVTEIAYTLGYSDAGSFSAAFKSWHGSSPRDFARRG